MRSQDKMKSIDQYFLMQANSGWRLFVWSLESVEKGLDGGRCFGGELEK